MVLDLVLGAFCGYNGCSCPRRWLCLLVCIARGFGLITEAVASRARDAGGSRAVEQFSLFSLGVEPAGSCATCRSTCRWSYQYACWHTVSCFRKSFFSFCQPKLKLACALCLWRFYCALSLEGLDSLQGLGVHGETPEEEQLEARAAVSVRGPCGKLSPLRWLPCRTISEHLGNFLSSGCQWKGMYWWQMLGEGSNSYFEGL